jgi:1,2-diacylglycerol 3-alpha-glucosyltransferase
MAALKRLAGADHAHAIEIAGRTRDYAWSRETPGLRLHTLCEDALAEQAPVTEVFFRARRRLSELRVKVCLLPSYFPKQSLALLMAAKSLRLKTVMMNESHAGTSRAIGVAGLVKKTLVCSFDAALVGGKPHKRYFAGLGLPKEKIFTGYDAVDNEFFSAKAQEIRKRKAEIRNEYGLPEHYFLSLGRFVAKKNLPTLIRAYRLFLDASPSGCTHLVLVGSGEEEPKLRALCADLRLPICEHGATSAVRNEQWGIRNDAQSIRNPQSAIRNRMVHFFGFRQIEENPAFYALADAFILPSLYEEWGLVVNEAMASAVPVVASETAGCAEDLLEPYEPEPACSAHALALVRKWGLGHRIRQNGFVFDPTSSEELSRILLLLEHAVGLRTIMGSHSRRIVEKFSCENFARNALLAVQAALMAPSAGRNRFNLFSFNDLTLTL